MSPESANDEPGTGRARHLLTVVGFDGSESAYRALDACVQLIAGRLGSIEVVYVAHLPAGSELSIDARVELTKGFGVAEGELADAAHARLDPVERRWRFRRRDGLVARELIAVADELAHDYGDDGTVVLVVGSPLQSIHHFIGSVPVALVRHATYPVIVVP